MIEERIAKTIRHTIHLCGACEGMQVNLSEEVVQKAAQYITEHPTCSSEEFVMHMLKEMPWS